MIKYAFEYFKSYSIGMQLKMQTMQILFISIELARLENIFAQSMFFYKNLIKNQIKPTIKIY